MHKSLLAAAAAGAFLFSSPAARAQAANACNDAVVQRVTAAAAGGTCVAGDAQRISLTWTAGAASNVVGYNVYRSSSFWGPYTKLNSAPVAATSYTDDGAPPGEVLYYTTTAVDDYNNERPSFNFLEIPARHSVALSWTASTSANVVGYNVYRGIAPDGTFTKLTPSPVAATGCTDYTVHAGETYYYAATAVDAGGNESAFSEVVQAVVPEGPPGRPLARR